MLTTALTQSQEFRLQRVARRAGRTPNAMLKIILREGFDACEDDIRENLLADEEFRAGKSVSHTDAMKRARAVIAAHGRRHRQAA